MKPLKTKIVCSMGPTTEDDETLSKIIKNGMNIARFNFSHGTHEYHRQQMERVRRLSSQLAIPVALMMDTKGPEIRTGDVENGKTILISKGDHVCLKTDGSFTTAASETKAAVISLNWKDFISRTKETLEKEPKKKIKVLIADGLLELDLLNVESDHVNAIAANSAKIGSRKNVNLIGMHARLPIMSEQDKSDIAFAAEMKCDFIAASFVSFPSEVHEIKRYLESLGSDMRIIAKIENEEGLNNIKEIADAADGIMVARGDLGVQLPTERIPLAQKHIISVCRKAGKPVITATQMLDSMIMNPRPTRAELTDVANAIFDGTDAVMLSGETASGSYPAEAVETMARIARTVEESEDYRKKMQQDLPENLAKTVGQTMAEMTYLTAKNIKAGAILVPTLSGHTATMISSFRPEQSIIAVTPDKAVQRKLLLNWGITPLCMPKIADDSEEMIQNAVKTMMDAKLSDFGDKIILCAGIPLQSSIPVNTIRVLIMGNILARGRNGGHSEKNQRKTGRIVKASSPEEFVTSIRRKKGEILMCPAITEDWIPVLRVVDGVISSGKNELSEETISLVNPDLVWISEIGKADKSIENGRIVTIDGQDLLVYEGIL